MIGDWRLEIDELNCLFERFQSCCHLLLESYEEQDSVITGQSVREMYGIHF
jgi:hypothetical protein